MPTKQKKGTKKRASILVILVLLIVCIFLYLKLAAYITPLFQLTFDPKITLRKAQNQRINVLLLGIGGGRHDGPLLTDTIMFASIDPVEKKATLITIPRDLWITDKKAKINTVYAYSEIDERGMGLAEAKKTVGAVLGQKIDYGFRIDFNGFIQAVDMLGGVDVTVERSFDDYAYPVSGKEDDLCGKPEEEIASISAQIATGSATDFEFFPCRFEHLHFDKGMIHMNGENALKFVRSRHALGPEGTDFARSKRQEKVIRAVKDKVFSAETFLNPVKLIELLDIFKASIDTDIKEDEIDDFIKLARKMREANIQTFVLDTGDQQVNKPGLLTEPLTNEEYGFQYIIIPRTGSGDYSEIRSYVSCVIKYGDECTVPPTPSSAE